MISYDPCTIAFRSTGSVPVPIRKGSTPNKNNKSFVFPTKGPNKRNSCPVLPCTLTGPEHNYGVQFKLNLSHASNSRILVEEECQRLIVSSNHSSCHPVIRHHVTEALLRPKVLKPHVEGRAVTHQADVIQEVRRGSMKERWGLDLVYRMHPDTLSLELAVARVTCPSPAHVSGLRPGHVITLVNDWKIEAMQVPEAVQTVLMAGGFFMKLGWLNQTLLQITDEWKSLGKF